MKGEYKKTIGMMLFTIILLLIGVNMSFSASNVNVVLANQLPDPISPGNIVELNVKVTNSGDTASDDVSLKFIENNNFKIVQGKEKTKDIGIIPPFSHIEGSRSFVIAKFLVEVSESVPLGENPISIELQTNSGVREYEFYITVIDQNPTISVINFQIDTVEPGKSSKLMLEVENSNSIDLSNIVISLNLDQVDQKVITVSSGSNQKVINNLPAGQKRIVEFELTVSPDAEAKSYLLPVTISYEDSFENAFTTQVIGSVGVFSEPMIITRVDSQEMYTIGSGKITLAISNPGTSTVKGTQIELLNSEDYEIIEGSYQYVGDLNPDDFQTIQVDAYIKNPDAVSLIARITYLDSYNNEIVKELSLPLKIYNEEELISLGIKKEQSGAFSSQIIIYLVILVVGFVIGRILVSRNKNKKSN